jgi:septum formation protein
VNVALVLASASAARQAMLRAAGLTFATAPVHVDEEALRAAMQAEAARPRDIADALAQLKALRAAARHPTALTLGADQVLDLDGEAIGKCDTRDQAAALLARLSGRAHKLFSAAVIAEGGKPVWRHVGEARLIMRALTMAEIEAYLDQYWDEVRHGVGCYRIEAEGIGLFDSITGDYHSILGLPLLPLLADLRNRGITAP